VTERGLLAEDEFLLSGKFHYFRVPRNAWRDRPRAFMAADVQHNRACAFTRDIGSGRNNDAGDAYLSTVVGA
jgi:hypothetical protein